MVLLSFSPRARYVAMSGELVALGSRAHAWGRFPLFLRSRPTVARQLVCSRASSSPDQLATPGEFAPPTDLSSWACKPKRPYGKS